MKASKDIPKTQDFQHITLKFHHPKQFRKLCDHPIKETSWKDEGTGACQVGFGREG